jgi:hypothetical protein
MKERKAEHGNWSSHRDIFLTFHDGDQEIRLVGEFLEVWTHYIAPAVKRGDRGLCQAKAFQGDKKIPVAINCLNWDIEHETFLPEKDRHCPFCKLNDIARKTLKQKVNAEEKKFFEVLRQAAYPRQSLKWHLIDRENSYVLKVVDGKEEKVKGLKIGTISKDLWRDIEGVFDQCGIDLADPKDGIDLCITKTIVNGKTSYSGKAMLVGKPPTVKVTPLTPEELAFELYDLKAICGKMVDRDLLVDALHGDIREILELNASETEVPPEQAPEDAQPVPPPPAATSSTVRRPVRAEAAEDDVLGGDDDAPKGPSSKKN